MGDPLRWYAHTLTTQLQFSVNIIFDFFNASWLSSLQYSATQSEPHPSLVPQNTKPLLWSMNMGMTDFLFSSHGRFLTSPSTNQLFSIKDPTRDGTRDTRLPCLETFLWGPKKAPIYHSPSRAQRWDSHEAKIKTGALVLMKRALKIFAVDWLRCPPVFRHEKHRAWVCSPCGDKSGFSFDLWCHAHLESAGSTQNQYRNV